MRATQLNLFEAHSELLAATVKYAKAVELYEADLKASPEITAPAKADATAEIQEGRALVNRLARIVANTRYKGVPDPYRAAWHDAYTELMRKTGYHPATELTHSKGTHLDMVCARGFLGELADIFRGLVTLPVTA